MKGYFALIIISIIILYVFIYLTSRDYLSSYAGKTKCSHFNSQEQAQRAFDSNHSKYAKLDGDYDGIACEGLPMT